MTKKDYELIANDLNATLQSKDLDVGHVRAVELVIDNLAAAFKKANDRFNVSKFKEACGIQGWLSYKK